MRLTLSLSLSVSLVRVAGRQDRLGLGQERPSEAPPRVKAPSAR